MGRIRLADLNFHFLTGLLRLGCFDSFVTGIRIWKGFVEGLGNVIPGEDQRGEFHVPNLVGLDLFAAIHPLLFEGRQVVLESFTLAFAV